MALRWFCALALLYFAAVPHAVSADQERVALVIGNGDYRHASKLANPRNDAVDIAQAMRDLNFEVIEGVDLDRASMESTIRSFSKRISKARLAVFFYAGHSVQVNGKNYLIPTDAALKKSSELMLDTIDVQVVLDQMELQSRVNIVFLDACRDNPLARNLLSSEGATRSVSLGKGLASMASGVGTMIAFATKPEAVAFDGEGRNSPFTTALLKHIRTPGADIGIVMRDGFVPM